MRNEREVAIEKLQNALLKLPKDDLVKLLKNTYQAMRVKHSIPHEKKPGSQDDKIAHTGVSRVRKVNKPGNSQNLRTVQGTEAKGPTAPKTRAKPGNRGSSGEANKMSAVEKEKGREMRENLVLEEAETEEGESEDEAWKLDSEIGRISLEKLKLDEEMVEDKGLFDKYLNFGEDAEQLTFRSMEIEIPQLDLRPAQEYIQRKNNPPAELGANTEDHNGEKNEEVLTPTFSPRKGVTYLPSFQNYQQSRSNSSSLSNYNTLNRNAPSYGSEFYGSVDLKFHQPSISRFGPPIYTQAPPNFTHPHFQPLRMVRRPFYARSRSLQRL